MDLRLREVKPGDPSIAEALGWMGRNLSLGAGFIMEYLGFSETGPDIDSIKRGVGMFAIAGAFEIVRRAEYSVRQTES